MLKIIVNGILNLVASPFLWSKWVDVCTFTYGYEAFLLQAKVNRLTNSKRFNVVRMKQPFTNADIKIMDINLLEKCGLINTNVSYPKYIE